MGTKLSWSNPRWLRSMGRLPVRNRLRINMR
jgi:hypothetical protein